MNHALTTNYNSACQISESGSETVSYLLCDWLRAVALALTHACPRGARAYGMDGFNDVVRTSFLFYLSPFCRFMLFLFPISIAREHLSEETF